VTEKTEPTPRILLAKIGLDGHDRGVKVLARSFRDAGIEVIYTGLWQTCETTMHAALQEDVDIVGVSLLSAAHMTVMPEIIRLREQLGLHHIAIMLGGIVPEADYPALHEMGVAAVFNPGSPLEKIIESVRKISAARPPLDAKEAVSGYARGEIPALARLVTAIQRDINVDGFEPPKGDGLVLGVTGSPGVGKSSFIAKLGRQLCERGRKVAVVAVDPSSPVTGGALLGDRLRMMSGIPTDKFFVRSLSSGSVQGGLGPRCREIIDALRGFGFDYILVETVGAGQSDVAIRELTEKIVLLLMPDSGDSIQFSKAGIMEIANCFVINKSDLSGVEATEGQLISSVGDDRPVWKVSPIRDEGIDKVTDWVESLK